ncbi:5-formyltetrahydrofolate cyclo-ligase [Clostridium saccharoperbutylacetonicum]
MTSINKKELRKEILRKRQVMDAIEKEKADNKITDEFLKTDYYKKAEKIFIYVSYDSEINTKGIINRALSDNKKIYVPRTDFKTKNMDAVEIISLDELMENSYGILEPSIEKTSINPNNIDLIVVPGVAFDRNGGRMGYGAGFYDRYFKKLSNDKIKKLVLAYDLQVVAEVPMEECDVPVDYIITEKEFIGCP